MMRALVTNDDGIESEGLRALAVAALDVGLEVVVAAPTDDASGSSAALTAVQTDGRIPVEEYVLDGLDQVCAYRVSAAPAFITLIATRGAFGPPPDVVVSGINRGLNTGNAVLHSGTVGAALTGRVHGCRALAVSIDDGHVLEWSVAAHFARTAMTWLLDVDDVVVLNLNVPNRPLDEIRGIRTGDLARFGAVQTTVAGSGSGWIRLGVVEELDEPPDRDTDAGLVARGFASLTALQPLCISDAFRFPSDEGGGG
jgi:5'-nucleotidase